MSHATNFRELVAWQKAMDLADLVYDITEHFPARERFGLALQMRRAAVSIASNIAEGNRRRTPGYIYHLEIARGSHGELDTQCELSTRRKFIPSCDGPRLTALIDEVGKLTYGLLRSLDPQHYA